jgi:uncharacterized protein YheU (UPF0270 family)
MARRARVVSDVDDGTMRENGIEVPHTRLPVDVLRRVAEEFVTRDGTDYGAAEKTLEEKVTDLRRQLERGDATIVYDAVSDTINVVARRGRRGSGTTAIVHAIASTIETEATMGDRSPKSKQRDQQQKNTAKATDAAAAKTKQDGQSRAPLPNLKGRK